MRVRVRPPTTDIHRSSWHVKKSHDTNHNLILRQPNRVPQPTQQTRFYTELRASKTAILSSSRHTSASIRTSFVSVAHHQSTLNRSQAIHRIQIESWPAMSRLSMLTIDHQKRFASSQKSQQKSSRKGGKKVKDEVKEETATTVKKRGAKLTRQVAAQMETFERRKKEGQSSKEKQEEPKKRTADSVSSKDEEKELTDDQSPSQGHVAVTSWGDAEVNFRGIPTRTSRRVWYKYLGYLLLLCLLLMSETLDIVPISGRIRPIFIPKWLELVFGEEDWKIVKNDNAERILPDSHPDVRRVKEIAGKIIATFPEVQQFNWEYIVIKDDKLANAQVLPGGKVCVYTGILPICKNDDGLAVILGHEIGHVVARHTVEDRTTAILLFCLSLALPDIIATEIWKFISHYIIELPFSRRQESEADHIGLTLMARARFNPEAAPMLWNRMAALVNPNGGSPEWYSTHPNNQRRAEVLQALIPKAKEEQERYLNEQQKKSGSQNRQAVNSQDHR